MVTTEKMNLSRVNLKQADTGDSKETASEKELSTESTGVCGRAESHGTPKQWLPESVCINSPGRGLVKGHMATPHPEIQTRQVGGP